jgi:peroxiredoxin
MLGWAQEKKAIINGTAEYKDLAVIHFMIYDKQTQTKAFDSVKVTEGKFSYTVSFNGLAGSIMMYASHNGKGITREDAQDVKGFLINESGATIHIKDLMRNAVITGDRIEEEKEKYVKYTYLTAADSAKMGYYINAVSPIIFDIQMKAPDSSNQKEFENYKKIMDQKTKMMNLIRQKLVLQREYVRQNPDSYFCLSALADNIRYGNNLDEIQPLYNSLSERLRNSPEAKDVLALLEKTKEDKLHPEIAIAKEKERNDALLNSAKKLAIGEMAPDFTLNNVNGKAVKLSDFKGKYVLLDFWASWCVPCRKENPNVVKAYQQFKDKNFTVVSIALEEKGKTEAWISAIKKDGLLWTQLVDFEGALAGKLYKISSIPADYLIDPSGRIIATNLSGEQLQNKLAEILSNF